MFPEDVIDNPIQDADDVGDSEVDMDQDSFMHGQTDVCISTQMVRIEWS